MQTALLLDAVSFYAIGWILLTAGPLPRGRARIRAGCGSASAPASRTSASKPTLRRLLAAQGAAFVFFAAVIPIEVIYAKETLGAGDTGYGLLLGSWGVGMVLGSLVFAAPAAGPAAGPALLQHDRGRRRLPRPGGRARRSPIACVASAVGGAGNGVQWVAVISAVQELTAPRMQARVIERARVDRVRRRRGSAICSAA